MDTSAEKGFVPRGGAEVGELLEGRYRITGILGQGGFATTFEAVLEGAPAGEPGRAVAIKELPLRGLSSWKQVELFEREARVLKKLVHPRIPRYLASFERDVERNGREEHFFYLVQERAPGRSLAALVEAGYRASELDARSIARQVLDVLIFLQGQDPPMVHRDIKPHNLIRDDEGTVRLVDFGSVRDAAAEDSLGGSTVAGTYGYMAPEQYRGLGTVKSDLYGLGATLLYLLSGKAPGQLPQSRLRLDFEQVIQLSPTFTAWLKTMLEPMPEDRFASARAALEALDSPSPLRPSRGLRPLWLAAPACIGAMLATAVFLRGNSSSLWAPAAPPRIAAPAIVPVSPIAPSGGDACTSGGCALRFDPLTEVRTGPTTALGLVEEVTLEAWVKVIVPRAGSVTVVELENRGLRYALELVGPRLGLESSAGAGLRFTTPAPSALEPRPLAQRSASDVQPLEPRPLAQRSASDVQSLERLGYLQPGRWHHLAATYGQSTRILYVDGVEVARGTATVPVDRRRAAGVTSQVTIGRNVSGPSLLIDEVRLWNHVRTKEQIAAHAGRELGGEEPGLIGYFAMNEGMGQEVRDRSRFRLDGWRGQAPGEDVYDPAWVADTPVPISPAAER